MARLFARITHIQTSAERDTNNPGRPHDDTAHTRQQKTGSRIQATRDQIRAIQAEQDAAYEHYKATGRYPN